MMIDSAHHHVSPCVGTMGAVYSILECHIWCIQPQSRKWPMSWTLELIRFNYPKSTIGKWHLVKSIWTGFIFDIHWPGEDNDTHSIIEQIFVAFQSFMFLHGRLHTRLSSGWHGRVTSTLKIGSNFCLA